MRILRHLTANAETLTPFRFRRELSMQSYLIENERVLELDDTYCDAVVITEELPVRLGRSSKATDGRIDLLVKYANEIIGVVELKLGELTVQHLDQLQDYLKAKEKILHDVPEIPADIKANPKWIGVLAGASISRELAEKVSSGETVEGVPIAAVTIQRFRGEGGQVYVATDVFFKNTLSAKDYSKYEFNGNKYGKGRLVLAVIEHIVRENPQLNFADLRRMLANKGPHADFVSSEEAFKKAEGGVKRHFINPDQLIKLANSTIAVNSQWGVENIGDFIERAEILKIQINKV